MKVLEKIFSVKNEYLNDKKHKVVSLCGIRIKLKSKPVKSIKIAHFSAFTFGNAGDCALVLALQKSIEKCLGQKIQWYNFFVHNPITKDVEDIINSCDLMLVGGGGLFLKDTNANDISGWQLPITQENLDNINVPIYMLAVGYNRFRNQEDFEPCFVNSINNFTKKAEFVGLRNNGSIEALKKYVDKNLHKKLIYHPCPTTIISKLFKMPKKKKGDKFIVLNCAFDRENMRYGDNEENILNSICRVVKQLNKKYKIKYYVHCETDTKMLPYLDNFGIDYSVEYLNKEMCMEDFIKLYSSPELVIGMRGHAQMLPFGCCTPILSIISHDKMNWFLNDVGGGALACGVDVTDRRFEEQLLLKADNILKNKQRILKEIKKVQNKLYKMTKNNIRKMYKIQN